MNKTSPQNFLLFPFKPMFHRNELLDERHQTSIHLEPGQFHATYSETQNFIILHIFTLIDRIAIDTDKAISGSEQFITSATVTKNQLLHYRSFKRKRRTIFKLDIFFILLYETDYHLKNAEKRKYIIDLFCYSPSRNFDPF